MTSIYEKMHQAGVIPVVKMDSSSHASAMAEALLDGGISAIEVTFRSEAAVESLQIIAKNFPQMLLLAGTVLTPEQADLAVQAGALGIVSPGTNPATLDWCKKQNVPIVPGIASPSEAEYCVRNGITVMKLFPAELLGGVKMLKALSGPYASYQFMPTGGIRLENMAAYLQLNNVLCCGGSWIAPTQLLEEENYAQIRTNAQKAVEVLRNVRAQ